MREVTDPNIIAQLEGNDQATFGQTAGRTLLRTGKDLGAGITGIGDVVNSALNSGLGLAGVNYQFPMPSQAVRNAFDSSTANTPYSTAPQNALERIADTGAEFISSAGPWAAASKAAPILSKLNPSSMKDLASFGTAGIGAGIGREVAPDSPLTQLGLSLVGALVPSAITNTPQMVKGALQSLTKVDPAKLQTFQEGGITPTLADVSNSPVVKRVQNFVNEVPFASGVIQKGIGETASSAEQVLNNAGLSQGKSAQQAGQIVKEGLEGYLSKGRQVISKLYNNLDQHIPGTDKVSVEPLQQVVGSIRNQAGITPGLAARLEGSEAGGIFNNIESDIGALNPGKSVAGETMPAQTIPYEAVKRYRTLVGNQLKDFQFLKSEDEAVLSKLYGGLTETMKQAASAKGPQALAAFNKANSTNAAFMQKAQEMIQPLLNRKDVQELFNTVLTQQKIGSRAQNVMNTLKPAQQQIVRGSLLKQMGENNVNEFSAIQAASKYAGLEPEAQKALTSGMKPADAQQFSKAMDALLLAKQTAAKGNPSGSLYGGIAAGAVPGLAFAPGTTISTLAGANITARLMTNQKFINWLAKAPAAKSLSSAIPALAAVATHSPEMAADVDKFKESLNKPTDQEVTDPEILKQLEAPEQPQQNLGALGGQQSQNTALPPGAREVNPLEESALIASHWNDGKAQPQIANAGNPIASSGLLDAEGSRNTVYKDQYGNRTVGIGFNMDDGSAKDRWRQAGIAKDFERVRRGEEALNPSEIAQLAQTSYNVAQNDAKALIPSFDNLSQNRKDAITQISYQMGGPRLSEFKPTIALIEKGDFKEAARRLLMSKYATQTPGRVRKLARMLAFDVPYQET